MHKAVAVTTLRQQPSTLRYWLSRPVAERLAAVEHLRQQHIAANFDAEPRLQRVCRVTQLGRR